MIPIIYGPTETAFESNGIGRLAECSRCVVTEELNGSFELEMDVPITAQHYEDLRPGVIISATFDERQERQPFVIYRASKPISGIVTFNARHISYRLTETALTPFSAGTAAEAMALIPDHCQPQTNFTFYTDISASGSFVVEKPISCRAALGGSEGSILDVFGGGEYEFDKFRVNLYANRGHDLGVTIRYGKNLLDINDTMDAGNIYDAVLPYWANEETVIMLPEVLLYAPAIQGDTEDWTDELGNQITEQNAQPLQFGIPTIVARPLDLSDAFDTAPTEAQLRTEANRRFNNNRPWLPNRNITVDFVALQNTTAYEDFTALLRVALADTVTVIYPELGTNAKLKVVKTVYNVLEERYEKIELGDLQKTYGQQILQRTNEQISALPTKGFLDEAIKHATELITGGLGGHVVFTLNADGEPEEILIMDTDSTLTAVNVWRFNAGGLGHSHNGYGGPYNDIALTMDGQINASMITTGIINANLITTGTMLADRIRAGTLVSQNNETTWNLNTGELTGALSIVKNNFSVAVTSGIQYVAIDLNDGEYSEHTATGYEIKANGGSGNESREAKLYYRNTSNGYESLFDFKERYMIRAADADYAYGSTQTTRYMDTEIHNVSIGSGSFDRYEHVYRHGSGYEDRCYQVYGSTGVEMLQYLFKTTKSGMEFTTVQDAIMLDPEPYEITFEAQKGASSQSLATLVPGLTGTYSGPYSRIIANRPSNNYNVYFAVLADRLAVTGKRGTATSQMLVIPNNASMILTNNSATINGHTVAYQSSSSRRYKENIKPITEEQLDPHRLYDLQPKQFNYHRGMILQYDDLQGLTMPGFIAEEVAEIYPAALIHNIETNEPESWDERRIIPGMLALIQEQKQKIDELERRLAALE